MALILLCEEVIEPTASAVMCVKNDRICDIIFQLYPSAWCQITPPTKTRTESENSEFMKRVIPETSNSWNEDELWHGLQKKPPCC